MKWVAARILSGLGGLLCGAGLLLPGPIPAQGIPVDTSGQLTSLALAGNPALRAQRERIRAAEQAVPQAKALPDPMADLEFMNLSVTDPSLKEALTEGISLGVTQVIPHAGKRASLEKVALAEVEVERARLAVMESEVAAQVLGAAYRTAALRGLLELNAEARLALESAAEAAAAAYASGRGSQAELLMAQAAVTRSLNRREELEAEAFIVLERLRRLLGGAPPDANLDSLELPDPIAVPPLDAFLEGLGRSAPSVLLARAEEEVGEGGVGVARAASKPDFTVGGRYRFRDMTMGGGDYLTASVGISLPFFHGKDRYRPALREALSRRESSRQMAEEALLGARFRCAESHRKAVRAERTFRLLRDGLLEQTTQAYESSLSSYAVGQIDYPALLMALTELFEAREEILTARADYQEALADAEAVLGAPLRSADPGVPAAPPTRPE